MPHRPRATPAPVIPSNALVASAVRYEGQSARIYEGVKNWQREVYRHLKICGEARAACMFYANAMSRATLHIATRNNEGKLERVKDGPGPATLAKLFGGADGQEQMLQAFGLHLTAVGECYLVGRTIDPKSEDALSPHAALKTKGDVWEVVSVTEMNVTGNKWSIRYGGNRKPIDLTDKDVVIRIWTPDPEDKTQADSPLRALLPVLTEIEWATRHIFKQLSSRLNGAGILWLPQEMTFPSPIGEDGKPMEFANQADAFMYVLADAMLTPIEDPGDVAASVPTAVQAPGDLIDKARLMTFWSEVDEKAIAVRTDGIHRFALGMDLPPEQVEGMSSNNGTGGGSSNGVSHWGAWQVEESTIKMHVEPKLDTVVNALTIGYQRPLVPTRPQEQVAYDTSKLRLRPDRSKESIILYEHGALSRDVMLRENGFDPSDAPDDKEREQFLLFKVASGSATPEQVWAALKLLGIDLPVPAVSTGNPAPQIGRETRPDPSLEDFPTRPRTPAEAAALLPAYDALVYRALERAGNRIRRDTGLKDTGVPAYETHTLVPINGKADTYLDDAWSCAPRVLYGLTDVDAAVKTLDGYCRSLFAKRAVHNRERLAEWLEVPS